MLSNLLSGEKIDFFLFSSDDVQGEQANVCAARSFRKFELSRVDPGPRVRQLFKLPRHPVHRPDDIENSSRRQEEKQQGGSGSFQLLK